MFHRFIARTNFNFSACSCFYCMLFLHSKYDLMVKVIRVCLDNQERLIGIQFPEILMSLAEKEAKQLALETKVCSVKLWLLFQCFNVM